MDRKGVVIASIGSGAGKTTLSVAIAAALKQKGIRVAPFKCGPDYLDPTYLSRVTGRECENLDPWMMGPEGLMEAFSQAMEGAEFALIEGVMGLFDGVAGRSEGSTAEVARLLGLPVILLIDATGMSATVGALFHGLREFSKEVPIGALICNRVAGPSHRRMLEEAVGREFFLGGLPRLEEALQFKSRHLGLLRADPKSLKEEEIERLARLAQEHIDLARLTEIARSPEPNWKKTPSTVEEAAREVRIAIARDEAFHFYYPYNLRLLESLGAELVEFSPLNDTELPEQIGGIIIGGGYPECYAAQLADNVGMMESVKEAYLSGMPIYAECGGLIYLTKGIHTLEGRMVPMVGLIEAECRLHRRLKALGYVEVETTEESILGPSGLRMRGHQFRYSELVPKGRLNKAYRVRTVRTGSLEEEGYMAGGLLASYVHLHWAYSKEVARGFVEACREYWRGRWLESHS